MEELIFQYLPIEVQASQSFGPLNRPNGTAVILVRGQDGQWILGKKDNFYPEGIVRMVGGGIDDGEHPAAAAQRELKEELAIDIETEKLIPLIHAEIEAHLPDKSTISGSIYVFYAQIHNQSRITADDDLTGIVHYADRDLNELVHRYAQLPEAPINNQHGYPTWAHYGQIWGPVHAAALARVKDLSLS